MKRLFSFVRSYNTLLVFCVLELISILLIRNQAVYESTYLFQRTKSIIGHLYAALHELTIYPHLKQENAVLHYENVTLKNQLAQVEAGIPYGPSVGSDPAYCFLVAHVINNSLVRSKNYLTLNKGAQHGIRPGMGVISAAGLVGKVKAVSDHFATVVSLLHTDLQIAAQLATVGAMGTVTWPGVDPFQAQLLYIPRHIPVQIGEKVITSGYNATFPAGITLGRVKRIVLQEGASFYDITLDLQHQLSTVHYVYVVHSLFQKEQQDLEQHTHRFYE